MLQHLHLGADQGLAAVLFRPEAAAAMDVELHFRLAAGKCFHGLVAFFAVGMGFRHLFLLTGQGRSGIVAFLRVGMYLDLLFLFADQPGFRGIAFPAVGVDTLGFLLAAGQGLLLGVAAVLMDMDLPALFELTDEGLFLAVAGIVMGVDLAALFQGADQLLLAFKAIAPVGVFLDLLQITDQGIPLVAAVVMDMDIVIRVTAYRHMIAVITVVGMGMELLLRTAGEHSLPFHGPGLIALHRMGMLLQSADRLSGHGDGRQDQGIGGAEHDHTAQDTHDPEPDTPFLFLSKRQFRAFEHVVVHETCSSRKSTPGGSGL